MHQAGTSKADKQGLVEQVYWTILQSVSRAPCASSRRIRPSKFTETQRGTCVSRCPERAWCCCRVFWDPSPNSLVSQQIPSLLSLFVVTGFLNDFKLKPSVLLAYRAWFCSFRCECAARPRGRYVCCCCLDPSAQRHDAPRGFTR